MRSSATTVAAYLKSLPAERREAITAVRRVILDNLPDGYEEGMQYGMIGYYVPHSVYPAGYHCDPKQPVPFAGLASQKNYMSLYLMCVYGNHDHEAWFRTAWEKSGKKLDMGKGCVRFKRVEDVPLEVVGQTIRRVPVDEFLRYYESVAGARRKASPKARTEARTSKRAPASSAKRKTRCPRGSA